MIDICQYQATNQTRYHDLGPEERVQPALKAVLFIFFTLSRIGAYEPTAPLVCLHSLGLSSVVETRQAHLPEVEWNTRALLNACLKPFTRWSLGYSRAVLIELTSCLAKLVKWFISQWTVCQRCAFLGEIRGKCYETTLLRKAVPAYLRRTVPNRSGSLWLTACHRNMNKVVQRINPNQDLYFKTHPTENDLPCGRGVPMRGRAKLDSTFEAFEIALLAFQVALV